MIASFDGYALDSERRELRRGNVTLSLEPKVFDLLAYLLEHRDRVVSRDELIASVWNGRIVSESALSSCINAARMAIADDGAAQRLIKTFPHKGIRFVGSVQGIEPREPYAAMPALLALPEKPSIAVLPARLVLAEQACRGSPAGLLFIVEIREPPLSRAMKHAGVSSIVQGGGKRRLSDMASPGCGLEQGVLSSHSACTRRICGLPRAMVGHARRVNPAFGNPPASTSIKMKKRIALLGQGAF
jgi:DNA-binding winged helix-turn-helix (wHTH) protein